MKIDELDEWQGLTVEMLHSWLLSHGWRLAACEQGCGKELVSPSNRRCNVLRSLEDFPWSWALIETRMTAQALLREINPRMRKGWPSGNALAMHDRWIVRKPDGAVIVCRWRPPYMVNAAGGADSARMISVNFALREQCEQWEFWPCDEHGNKVRWPTDAEGKML